MINPFKYKIKPKIFTHTHPDYPDIIITEKIYTRRGKPEWAYLDQFLHIFYLNNNFIGSYLGYWTADVCIQKDKIICGHTGQKTQLIYPIYRQIFNT